jgi:peptide/nickel transport system permease protein
MVTAPTVGLPEGDAALRRALEGRGYWHTVWERLRRDKVTLAVMVILGAIVFAAVFAPLLSPYSPYEGSALTRLQPIGTPGHVLGTDE